MAVVNIYSKFDDDLKDVWHEFEEMAQLFGFQTYDWLSKWYQIIGKPIYGIQSQIVVVYQEGQIVGIFPLGIRKVATVRVLEWLGGVQTDYHGPVISNNWALSKCEFSSCWSDVLQHIQPVDVIHLRRQPSTIGCLENPFYTLDKVFPDGEAYSLNLPEDVAMFHKIPSLKRLLADSRRQRRRLSDCGEVEFAIDTSTPESKIVIREMINLKRQRYRAQNTRDQLRNTCVQRFYEELFSQVGRDGRVYISTLKVDSEVIAVHWGIVYRDRFYYLMPAFKGGSWEKMSAGRLLLEFLVEWSIGEGFKTFDFTIGAEEYKKSWCDSKEVLFQTIKSANWKGNLYSSLYWLYRIFIGRKRINRST